jgi:putative MATE family efflux protein
MATPPPSSEAPRARLPEVDPYAKLPAEAHEVLALSPTLAVLKLGLPLALASFFQAGFNLTEVWVFGKVGDNGASLAGAAVSDMLTALFALLASGLGNAAVTQISQATGAGNEERARAAARSAVFIGLLLSLGSAVVGLMATPLGEAFMHPTAREAGTAFLRIMALGGFGTVFMVVAIGILRARGDSVRPLVLIACVSIATLLLEMAFIFGWGGLDPSGIVPCAWVTVILRGLTGIWGLWMVNGTLPLRPARGTPFVDRKVLSEQVRMGLISAVQQSVRVLGMLALVALANLRLAEDSGHNLFIALTVWSKIDIPMIMLAFAWGGATAPIVGMSLGAKEPEHARRAAWAGARVAAFAALVNVMMVFVFGADLVSAFLPTEPGAAADALSLLHHIAPVYPLMALGMAIAYAFNGAGDMVRPLIWDAVLLLVVQGALAFFLGAEDTLAATGFFIALTISGVFQGLVPAFLLYRRRWS